MDSFFTKFDKNDQAEKLARPNDVITSSIESNEPSDSTNVGKGRKIPYSGTKNSASVDRLEESEDQSGLLEVEGGEFFHSGTNKFATISTMVTLKKRYQHKY